MEYISCPSGISSCVVSCDTIPSNTVAGFARRGRTHLGRVPFGRFGDSWSKDSPILSLAVVLLSKMSPTTSSLEGCGKADSDEFGPSSLYT